LLDDAGLLNKVRLYSDDTATRLNLNWRTPKFTEKYVICILPLLNNTKNV